MFSRFFLFSLLLCACVFADAPDWNLNDPNKGWADDDLVLEYFHHSELQRQWAWELVGLYPPKEDEKVLDFGCGDGKITAQLSHHLPKGKIIGVDLSKKMISFAERSFPKKYYPSLSFCCSSDTDFEVVDLKSSKKFDKIYSFFVFHLVPNSQVVLGNLRGRIAENGELILVIPMGGNKPFFEAATRTFEEYGLVPPWKKNNAIDKPKLTMRTLEGIKANIESSGWEISYLNETFTPHFFVNRDEFVHWMTGTTAPNWDIPKSIAPDFFNRLVTHMCEIEPTTLDEKGVYSFYLSRIHIVAKPK